MLILNQLKIFLNVGIVNLINVKIFSPGYIFVLQPKVWHSFCSYVCSDTSIHVTVFFECERCEHRLRVSANFMLINNRLRGKVFQKLKWTGWYIKFLFLAANSIAIVFAWLYTKWSMTCGNHRTDSVCIFTDWCDLTVSSSESHPQLERNDHKCKQQHYVQKKKKKTI